MQTDYGQASPALRGLRSKTVLTHFVRKEKLSQCLTGREWGFSMARSAVVPVRLTLEERELLHKKASDHRISLSEFIRRMALSRRLPPKPAPEVNKSTYQELARIGNNLNQLLRALHEGRIPFIDTASLTELVELRRTLKLIGLQVLGYDEGSSS